MSMEYRPAQDKEMREFYYSGRIGFGRSLAVEEVDRDLQDPLVQSEQTLCAFDDGVLAAKMLTLPLGIYWNGAVVDCGGITAVSTLPSHRRRGHVRELLRRSFITMRESGQSLALLWASMAAIYQRFGFGMAFASLSCSFDARRLRFVDAIECPGRIDILDVTNAISEVNDAYHRFAAERTTALRRDDVWRARLSRLLIRPRGDTGSAPLLVAAYREAATVLGYVVYGIERLGPGRPMPRSDHITVHELVWLNAAAHEPLFNTWAPMIWLRTFGFVCSPLMIRYSTKPRIRGCSDSAYRTAPCSALSISSRRSNLEASMRTATSHFRLSMTSVPGTAERGSSRLKVAGDSWTRPIKRRSSSCRRGFWRCSPRALSLRRLLPAWG
jgi:predicted N-acetyltransferase YhbS